MPNENIPVIDEWKNTNALFMLQAYGMDTCHISNQSISSQYIPGVLLITEIFIISPSCMIHNKNSCYQKTGEREKAEPLFLAVLEICMSFVGETNLPIALRPDCHCTGFGI